jgi:membrane protease YdiL (CAAX protease family)
MHVIYRYACWCVFQQLLLQNMTYRRLRSGLGASWSTLSIAGAMFALAHIPNPILVPATFVWGTVSARLFEPHPSH